MTNMYWPVYKNLEKELLELSNQVHFDDKQLIIYSIKITELILRCAIEIEAISKELYFSLGGEKATNRDVYFDTECIQLLEDKWLLSKKEIIVSATNFHFTNEENKILTPLKNANKRGSSSSDWKKSYQAIKHDRVNELSKGNLKHLIRIMAALFILNVYYKDDEFDLKNDPEALDFNSNLGSEIFSIKIHKNSGVSIKDSYAKQSNFDECIYLSHATEETLKIAQEEFKKVQDKQNKLYLREIKRALNDSLVGTDIKTKVEEISKEINVEKLFIEATRETSLVDSMKKLKYEAVLNKNQIK